MERNFEATAPNKKWVADVTEFRLFGQKLYLSPILDLYSRDIVSLQIFDSIDHFKWELIDYLDDYYNYYALEKSGAVFI